MSIEFIRNEDGRLIAVDSETGEIIGPVITMGDEINK